MTQVRENIHTFSFSLIASNYFYPMGPTWVEYGRIEHGHQSGTQEENTDTSMYTYFKIKKLNFMFTIRTSNILNV